MGDLHSFPEKVGHHAIFSSCNRPLRVLVAVTFAIVSFLVAVTFAIISFSESWRHSAKIQSTILNVRTLSCS
jgi:hypothetical protein